MPNDYYTNIGIGAFLIAAFGSLVATAKMLAGIKPRLERVEKDVGNLEEDKLNKETFKEVKDHIDTKFKHQEGWLQSVDTKLDNIANNMERRGEPRKETGG